MKVTATQVHISVEEFEKLLSKEPKLKEVYDALVKGTMVLSGEDESQIRGIIANEMLRTIQTGGGD